jgi:hypothetical protein
MIEMLDAWMDGVVMAEDCHDTAWRMKEQFLQDQRSEHRRNKILQLFNTSKDLIERAQCDAENNEDLKIRLLELGGIFMHRVGQIVEGDRAINAARRALGEAMSNTLTATAERRPHLPPPPLPGPPGLQPPFLSMPPPPFQSMTPQFQLQQQRPPSAIFGNTPFVSHNVNI